jgi:hypothetical protein
VASATSGRRSPKSWRTFRSISATSGRELWAEGKIFLSILAVVSILALLYFILVFLGSIAASYMAIKDCLGSCCSRASVPDDIEMD